MKRRQNPNQDIIEFKWCWVTVRDTKSVYTKARCRLRVKRRNTHPEEMFSALHLKADSSQTSRHDCFVPKPEVFNGLGHVPLAQWMSAVLSRHRYHRRAAPCTRIKHLVTCRSQYNMHLLLFVPPPGLAHLPTQFAA
jgi:hypothetical protein